MTAISMPWCWSSRADPRARALADRHYSRKTIGATQFVPPGRCLVLYANHAFGQALWVTSWPFAEYVKHQWAGAWLCSAFRNENFGSASQLIRLAVAATKHRYGEPPSLGMVTFVDRSKVRPTRVRGKDIWGWTFRKAGFVECGETKGGLLALQLHPQDMPPAQAPLTDLEVAANRVAEGPLIRSVRGASPQMERGPAASPAKPLGSHGVGTR